MNRYIIGNKRLRDSNKAAIHAGCCCTCPYTECGPYDCCNGEPNPAAMDITLDNQAPICCGAQPDLNSTYRATLDGNDCSYKYTHPDPVIGGGFASFTFFETTTATTTTANITFDKWCNTGISGTFGVTGTSMTNESQWCDGDSTPGQINLFGGSCIVNITWAPV